MERNKSKIESRRGACNAAGITRLINIIGITGTLAVPPQMVRGADTDNQSNALQEIVVTAEKREQLLKDVGAPVTAFTSADLHLLGFESSSQIAAQTPGLYFAEGPLSHLPLSNIRGVSQNDFTGHIEPPNAVYVDQAYVSFQGATAFQMYDLQRVEVLKGPQGTLYGRNATGGLLHYLSVEPTSTYNGYATVEGGQLGEGRFEGAIGGPIQDNLQYRVSALYHRTSPYVSNAAGPDLMGFKDSGLRAQLKWEPTDTVTARVIYAYGSEDHTHAFQYTADGFLKVNGLEFTLPGNLNYWGTCPGCGPTGFRGFNGDPWHADQSNPGLYRSHSSDITGIVTWNLSHSVALTSVTNNLVYDFFYQEDSDLSPILPFGLLGQRTGNYAQQSQELRLNGEAEHFHWLGGTYFLHRKTEDTANQRFSAAWFNPELSLLFGVPPAFLLPPGSVDQLLSEFEQRTLSWAVFGQTEYDFATNWTLVTGLRWSHDSLHYKFVSTENVDGVVTSSGLLGSDVFTPATVGPLAEQNKGEWSGHFAVHYKPTADLLTYMGVSRGNKAGGWNGPFTGGRVHPFQEEVLTNYEGGFKATLADGRAQLNVSAFRYIYHNYQGFVFVNLATQFRNLNAHVNGEEADLAWAPGGGWQVRLGVSNLHTSADTAVPTATGSTDTRLPLAPTWSGNALLRKTWTALSGKVSAQVDGQFASQQYSDVLNNPSGLIRSHSKGDARLDYVPHGDHWLFALMLRNFNNDRTPIFRIPTGLGWNQDMYDPPRQWLGEASYSF